MNPFSKHSYLFKENPLQHLTKCSILLTGLFASTLLMTCWVTAEEFKSFAAKAAQQEYEAAISKAKADYIKKLEAALEQAYKTKSLDEANLINDELVKLKGGEVKAEPEKVKEKKPTLVIISAKWGYRSQVIDVKEFIENLIKDDAIDSVVGGYPDPAHRQPKTLTIEYSIRGIKKTFTGIDGEFLRLNVPTKKK